MPSRNQLREVVDAFINRKHKKIRQYHTDDNGVFLLYNSIVATRTRDGIMLYKAMNSNTTLSTYKELLYACYNNRNIDIKAIDDCGQIAGLMVDGAAYYFPWNFVIP